MKRRAMTFVCLAALTGACGGGQGATVAAGPARDGALVMGAATKVAGATTYRFNIDFISNPGAPGERKFSAAGANDRRRGLMEFGTVLPATVPGGGSKSVAIMGQTTMWYQLPDALRADAGGKAWFKATYTAFGQVTGQDESTFQQLREADPAPNVAALSAGATEITEAGTEAVRGVTTRHFKLIDDPARVTAASHLPASLKEKLARTAGQLDPAPYPAEIWIGPDGYPRRLEITRRRLPKPGTTAAPTPTLVRIEFYDYGANVGIKLPPARDTADLG